MQVHEGDGLQTILALLPTPFAGPSASDAAATATASTGAAPAWANKPQSSRLQSRLLQLLAAILQSAVVRSSILSTDGSPSSMVCLSVLLNILNPDAPQLPVALPVAVTPAVGKGAVGKADGKAKAGGKGKSEAVPPLAAVPPPELLPPFPTAVQLPAVQCLQVSTFCANRLDPVLVLASGTHAEQACMHAVCLNASLHVHVPTLWDFCRCTHLPA